MEIKFTRSQYIKKDCTHRQYYAQFVTENWPDVVASKIGHERLRKCLGSENFFYHQSGITLDEWAALPVPHGTGQAMRQAGDWQTSSGVVCLNKEAALQWLERKVKPHI